MATANTVTIRPDANEHYADELKNLETLVNMLQPKATDGTITDAQQKILAQSIAIAQEIIKGDHEDAEKDTAGLISTTAATNLIPIMTRVRRSLGSFLNNQELADHFVNATQAGVQTFGGNQYNRDGIINDETGKPLDLVAEMQALREETLALKGSNIPWIRNIAIAILAIVAVLVVAGIIPIPTAAVPIVTACGSAFWASRSSGLAQKVQDFSTEAEAHHQAAPTA